MFCWLKDKTRTCSSWPWGKGGWNWLASGVCKCFLSGECIKSLKINPSLELIGASPVTKYAQWLKGTASWRFCSGGSDKHNRIHQPDSQASKAAGQQISMRTNAVSYSYVSGFLQLKARINEHLQDAIRSSSHSFQHPPGYLRATWNPDKPEWLLHHMVSKKSSRKP